MSQATLFILFFLTLMAAFYAYFVPKQQMINPLKVVMFDKDPNNTESSDIKKVQEVNMSTNSGIIEIHRQIDSLTQEKIKLQDEINDEQQVLSNTNNEIAGIKEQLNGKNDQDMLKLKALGTALEDQQRLLVEHGKELIALNDQLDKNRQLIAEGRDLVNTNTESSLQSLRDNNASQHAQDLIDEEHQKAQDQQEMIQQRIADQMQRAQDQQDR